MKLKPEFDLLNSYYKQLYADIGVDQVFLEKVRAHIELCEDIAEADREKSMAMRTTEYDKERSVIVKAKRWWVKRAEPFGMTMAANPPAGGLPNSSKTSEQITAFDKRFLRSICIAADEPSKDEDDGA